jgi:GNAT superfamily N-acetyltransferase
MHHANRQNYVNINYNEQVALAAVQDEADGEKFIGLIQYIKNPNSSRAEVALLVGDEWQKRRMGTKLMHYIIRIARQSGITGFEAEVLMGNKGMMSVFESLPYKLQLKLDSGTYHLTFDFDMPK